MSSRPIGAAARSGDEKPLCMMNLIGGIDGASDQVLGSFHADAGGFVAWDHRGRFLGKNDRHRFTSRLQAINAVIDAAAEGARPEVRRIEPGIGR